MILSSLLEKDTLPDPLIRFGIRRLLRQRLREEDRGNVTTNEEHLQALVQELRQSPIAIETAAANEQHYEVPTRFYELCLGPRKKYSSALYPREDSSLAEAEEAMLTLSCERAELRDEMEILELGCGWGSLSLWMAEKYPRSRITGVSNSRTQKEFIDAEASRRGFKNLTIITCDMNHFHAPGTYDRVVSVEMFEHMKNYERLLRNIAGWLRPDGKLFVHIFSHRDFTYHFQEKDESDWMARYFFTGGIMPGAKLLLHFQDDLRLECQWNVNGTHYERTANHWLANLDAHEPEARRILADVYGPDNVTKWWVYWRVFFMACAELWGFRDGNEWMVSHYRFRKG